MKEKNPSLLIVLLLLLLLLLLQKFLSSFFFFSSSFSLQKSFHASSSCTKPSITGDAKPMLKKRILHS
jgi:flagellar basal body-associated protein FliL